MTGSTNRWDDVYRERADTDVSWYEARPDTSLRLIEETGVSRVAGVVDVGGGASRLVDTLLEQGYTDLTVLDLSPTALSRAAERLPQDAPVTWVTGDILDWHPDRRFALWHDRAAFHFLTDPSDQERYVALVSQALEPGGFAVIGTFALNGPERCSGLPVTRYDAAALARRLGPEFELVRSLDQAHQTPGGTTQNFHYGVLRRL